jgi:hypothetical protein
MTRKDKYGMTALEQAELITQVCERFMAAYLRDMPELEVLRNQARALFPYRTDSQGTTVYGPSVVDRLKVLEENVQQLLAKVQVF